MNRIVTMVLKNLPIVPGAWFKLCKYAKHTDEYPEVEKWRHIQYILRLAVNGGNIDLKVTGLENIPQDTAFMMYANHQGMFDVLAIAATCDAPLGAVLKKELYNVPFLHQIALCTKSFAMDREDVRQSLTVIQNVTEEVKKGRNYLIFPEGTRSKTCELLPFHNGVFKIAQKADVPIVVLSITGTEKIAKATPFRRTDVYLDVLEVFSNIKETKTELIGTAARRLMETNIERRELLWQKDM